MSALAVQPQPLRREEKVATRSSQPGTKGSVTIESLFEQCARDIKVAAERTPAPTASQLSSVARKVDDSYFRLQIWGSDLSGDSQQKITFTDILGFKDSPVSEKVHEILEKFQGALYGIGDILAKILEHAGKADVEELLLKLRTSANDISELVRGLVDLSSSIQIEQALCNNVGPHKHLQDSIESTKETIERERAGKEGQTDGLGLPGPNVRSSPPEAGGSHGIYPSTDASSPWAGKNILTLDGGGARSYSTLLILRSLMQKVDDMEANQQGLHPQAESAPMSASNFSPCHYFDYIVGTSTGGLIAIMLGRLRMDINECIDTFLRIAKLVFTNPRTLSIAIFPLLYSRAKYSHKALENEIQDIVKKRIDEPDLFHQRDDSFLQPDQVMCKTMVLSYQENEISSSVLLRSFKYDNPQMVDLEQIRITQAARATSAAPTYFKPAKVGDRTFIDGAVGGNNPTVQAFNEVHEICKLDNSHLDHVALVCSIGSGHPKVIPAPKPGGYLSRYKSFAYFLKTMMLDTEHTNNTMQYYALMEPNESKFRYSRFNPTGLGMIRFDQWNNNFTKEIESATLRYIEQPEITKELEKIARSLVEIRLRRSKTPQWAAFCGRGVKMESRLDQQSGGPV